MNPASAPERASEENAPLRHGPISAVWSDMAANASQRAERATDSGCRQPGVNIPLLCGTGVE
jgi:hypothetical protein